MNPRIRISIVTLLLVTAAAGCGMRQAIQRPTLAADVDKLDADLDVLPPFPEPASRSGSLWTDAGPGAALVRDHRAFRLNDLVTVVVQESSAGTNASTTDLSRSSATKIAAPLAFGNDTWADFLDTDITSDSEFTGDGTTGRSSQLTGTITTRVMRVLQNGDMVIAGQKTVMVNRERQILTLVGSIRPVDINRSNRVSSSDVGDLTVRMWGRGEVDDTIRQGWFMRVMHKIWPF